MTAVGPPDCPTTALPLMTLTAFDPIRRSLQEKSLKNSRVGVVGRPVRGGRFGVLIPTGVRFYRIRAGRRILRPAGSAATGGVWGGRVKAAVMAAADIIRADMVIYAGIDEAGYGPMFGPLVIGCAVLGVAGSGSGSGAVGGSGDASPPNLWQKLRGAVCRSPSDKRGRLAVNDSKKLHSRQAGIRHLERGVLAFAAAGGHEPTTVGGWLDGLGETTHHELADLPWYAPCDARPWQAMPTCLTAGECQIARSMLAHAAGRVGVSVLDLGAAVVFEDRFNRMVAATRSKAATSFTFVAGHLLRIWERYGREGPTVVVDRQSGRMRYRELLSQALPSASIRVVDESPSRSAYHLSEASGDGSSVRRMTVSFEVDADGRHLPAALASMLSKYTRELLMQRFQAWFSERLPSVKPTAGYATDAKRFWEEIEPSLPGFGIDGGLLRRMS